MREKLQTLPLTELKELAKAQGIRGISGMKKSDLIDLLCEKDKEAEDQKKPAPQRQESGDQARKSSGSNQPSQPQNSGQGQPQNQPPGAHAHIRPERGRAQRVQEQRKGFAGRRKQIRPQRQSARLPDKTERGSGQNIAQRNGASHSTPSRLSSFRREEPRNAACTRRLI